MPHGMSRILEESNPKWLAARSGDRVGRALAWQTHMARYHIVQIGAHLAQESRSAALAGALCLFVEPVPHLHSELQKKFAGLPNVAIEGVAVAVKTGFRPIHYLSETQGLPHWADQIGSLTASHITGLAAQSGFAASYRGALAQAEVRCVRLADLLGKYGITQVDNLIVDTEGMDYEILSDFDFSCTHVTRLVFERKHTDGVRKTTYRYNHLVDKLQQIGYVVVHLDHQNDEAMLSVPFDELNRRMLRYRQEDAEEEWFRSHRGERNSERTMPRSQERGVVYLALGRKHYLEAQKSIHSLLLTNPGIPVTVFTDEEAADGFAADYRTIRTDRSAFKLKIRAMAESPYLRTLFLDTDTRVVGPLDEIFDALTAHDWCIAESPLFHYDDGKFVFDDYRRIGTFNTGVIAFKMNHAIQKLLDVWAKSIELQPDADIRPGHMCDQWYFNNRIVMDEAYHTLKTLVISNVAWNLRSYALGKAVQDGLLPSVRIIHARPWEVRQFWGMNLDEVVSSMVQIQTAEASADANMTF
jgi:FkbM family methyltransferase